MNQANQTETSQESVFIAILILVLVWRHFSSVITIKNNIFSPRWIVFRGMEADEKDCHVIMGWLDATAASHLQCLGFSLCFWLEFLAQVGKNMLDCLMLTINLVPFDCYLWHITYLQNQISVFECYYSDYNLIFWHH